MKKLISVLLLLSIVFLGGCSAMFVPASGLAEINGLDKNTNYVLSAELGEKYWVLLSSVFIPDSSEQEEVSADTVQEVPEEEVQGEYYYQLTLVDPDTAKVVRSADIKDCPFEDITGVSFDKDGNIVVFNEFDKVSALYSKKLKKKSEKLPYEVQDTDAKAKKNKIIDDSFSRFETFASDYIEFLGDKRVNAYAFYGEDNKIYLAENERFSPFCGYEKRVLGTMITEAIESKETIRVYDFATSTLVNEIKTPDYGKGRYASLSNAVLRGESAFLVVGDGSKDGVDDDETFTNHYYLWYYNDSPLAQPFEAESVTQEQLEGKNRQLCKQIQKDYGIEVLINQPNQSTLDKDEVYSLVLTATPYKVYYTLTGLCAFFAKLPAGLVTEVYTGMEHIHPKGFRIYLAKEIVGYPNAYANRWGDYFEMALSTDCFSTDTLSHEFMHLMDARLDDCYWEENLDDVWSESNPEGFEYMGYEEDEGTEWDEKLCEKYEAAFITRYAMSAATEDRADTFSSLFSCGIYNDDGEKPYWYKQGTAAAQKAVLLCGMIRAAFPCMNGAPIQPWETPIAGDLNNIEG